MSDQEKQAIRIFTFGGWYFVGSSSAHSESHNYASMGDLIPRSGSFNLQYLAIRRQEGRKEGLNDEEIIRCLAFREAAYSLDSLDTNLFERYVEERCKHYRNEFEKIKNVTILDSMHMWEHSFNNESYQTVVSAIIDKYRKKPSKIGLVSSRQTLLESLV